MSPAFMPSSVLFSCTRNVVRSPIAEALFSARIGAKAPHPIYVDSAGVDPGEPDPFVIAVMAEIGLDLSDVLAKSYDDLEQNYFDLIVTLSPEAHRWAEEFTRTSACELEYWPVPDPTEFEGSREEMLAAYRQVRDLLQQKIADRFGR